MSPIWHSAFGTYLCSHCSQLPFWSGTSSSQVTTSIMHFHAECSCNTKCLKKVDENSGTAQMQRWEIQRWKQMHFFLFSLSPKKKMSQLAWNPKRLIPSAIPFHSKHFSWIVRVISFLCSHPKCLLVKYDFAVITTYITGGLSHSSWPSHNANVSKTLRINVRFCLWGLSLPSLEIDKQSIILCFRAYSGHLWRPGFTYFSFHWHTTTVFINLSSSVYGYLLPYIVTHLLILGQKGIFPQV